MSGIILPQGIGYSNNGQSRTSTPLPNLPPELNKENGQREYNEEQSSSTSTVRPDEQFLNYVSYVDKKVQEKVEEIKIQQQELLENKISLFTTDFNSKMKENNERLNQIDGKFKERKEDKKHNQLLWISIIGVAISILSGIVIITVDKYKTINELETQKSVIEERVKQIESDNEDIQKDIKYFDRNLNSSINNKETKK